MTDFLLSHLLDVGRTKALGLLSHKEIRACGAEPAGLCAAFNTRTRCVARNIVAGDIFWDKPVAAGEESLVVADLDMLQAEINASRDAVAQAGWPVDAAAFLKKSLEHYIRRSDGIYAPYVQDVIRRAYAQNGVDKKIATPILKTMRPRP